MNPISKEDTETESFPCSSLLKELVEEILLRLPADSLVRFKCVCKSWNALINDRAFVNEHLRRITDYEKILLFNFCIGYGTRGPAPSLLDTFRYYVEDTYHMRGFYEMYRYGALLGCREDDRNNDDLHYALNGPDLMQCLNVKQLLDAQLDSELVVTHCNGIICMVEYFMSRIGDVYMCNPVLKEFKHISPPDVMCGYTIVGDGFGYDSSSDDYKFVRIWVNHWSTTPYKVYLYTLGTDSWTQIKLDIEIGLLMMIYKKLGVYCKNVNYWIISFVKSEEVAVLAFDMSEEKFRRIQLPFRQDDSMRMARNTLASWKDSLVLFCRVGFREPSSAFEMWVLVDKVGGDAFWTKHLTIGPLESVYETLEFWKDDELLVRDIDEVILSYNIYTKKKRTISIDLMVSPFRYYVKPYVKSLVSIKSNQH